MEVENLTIETKKMTYSYNDGELYYFVDEDFEMVSLTYEQVKNELKYLKELDDVTVKLCNGNAISIELENVVELTVIEAQPAVSCGTINETKSVVLQTGVVIQVPTYIELGDVVWIDTKTGRLI